MNGQMTRSALASARKASVSSVPHPESTSRTIMRAPSFPLLSDALTVHGVLLNPICQEELYNPVLDVSINPNENSILTP